MNEAMRNLAVLVWAVCAINNNSYASDNKMIIAEEAASSATPTIVYGAAKEKDGGEDEFAVEQAPGAPNPLGEPIEAVADVNKGDALLDTIPEVKMPKNNTEMQAGNRVVPPSEAQKLGKDFQNTIEESNGMIYDIQAYPAKDLGVMGDSANPQTIYSPNVNPN